jgi:Domain of unknown function (DUF4136)
MTHRLTDELKIRLQFLGRFRVHIDNGVKRMGLIPALILLMAGCASVEKYRVNVDSMQAPGTDDKKHFILFPGSKDTSSNDPQFREYAGYINRALISRGFVPAESVEQADLAIFVVYGIRDPQQHPYTYSVPVMGYVDDSFMTSGTRNRRTTIYPPTYGITGYTSEVGTYTTYLRFLVLDAIDLSEYKKSEKKIQLWKTTVTSRGSSDDLRRVFPIMVSASKPHIATNSGQPINIEIDEDDPSVLEITGRTSAAILRLGRRSGLPP